MWVDRLEVELAGDQEDNGLDGGGEGIVGALLDDGRVRMRDVEFVEGDFSDQPAEILPTRIFRGPEIFISCVAGNDSRRYGR